jgi:hypothetical protein
VHSQVECVASLEPEERKHPMVMSCDYVVLKPTSEVGIVTPSEFVRPERIIPHLSESLLDRQATAYQPPHFFSCTGRVHRCDADLCGFVHKPWLPVARNESSHAILVLALFEGSNFVTSDKFGPCLAPRFSSDLQFCRN